MPAVIVKFAALVSVVPKLVAVVLDIVIVPEPKSIVLEFPVSLEIDPTARL